MAVDASILAIPGLGSLLPTKTMCSISFVLSAYCIIACAVVQRFSHRMRSLDFAVRLSLCFRNLDLTISFEQTYYLHGKMTNFLIVVSIPSLLYLTR
jgi:hypothetical protein